MPATNQPTRSSALSQLKDTIECTPGIVRNATDARNYLERKQWVLPAQGNTQSTLTIILFSLVAAHEPRITTDKIAETPANVIKAVAYFLEEVTVAEYADKIAAQLNRLTGTANSDPTVNNTTTHIEQALNAMNDTTKKQTESIE
jgi:hypothetical protein